MSACLGYYVHHHGAGHLQRARVIARAMPRSVTLLGTDVPADITEARTIQLPDDRRAPEAGFDGQDSEDTRPESLHYAPLSHPGVRTRMATLSAWIASTRPELFVVDVSVEVAMLARLLSVPVVYVRLNGRRTDPAHLDAFRSARAMLAPYHADLDDPLTPDWVRARTFYCPGLSPPASVQTPDSMTATVVIGRGGDARSRQAAIDSVMQAAAVCPGWQWEILGSVEQPIDPPSNISWRGWVDKPQDVIARATVVVGAAGDGLVSAVLAAGRPLICIPESRPFGEQQSCARGLRASAAAVVCERWPAATEWPSLLQRAQALPADRRARLHSDEGPQTAARWLTQIALRRRGCMPR